MKHLYLLTILLVLAGCEVQKEAKNVVIEDYYIKNELLVQMYEMEKIPEMESAFKKEKLELIDEVSPRLRMVLLRYDTTQISPQKMFAKLKLSGYCRELEFNKKVQSRN